MCVHSGHRALLHGDPRGEGGGQFRWAVLPGRSSPNNNNNNNNDNNSNSNSNSSNNSDSNSNDHINSNSTSNMHNHSNSNIHNSSNTNNNNDRRQGGCWTFAIRSGVSKSIGKGQCVYPKQLFKQT